jgi:hypothetical protein
MDEIKVALKWPKPRGIVDATKSYAEQKKQLTAWMEGKLSLHFKVKEEVK